MTQKQFKEDLLRGRGCCFQAVKIEPEKFYKEVLWACRNELAFDAQCEGTRAWFLYQMISCYENRGAFLNTTIRAFDSAKSDGGWKLLYLAELLNYFACDGEDSAKQALWRKYEKIHSDLLASRRRTRTFAFMRDDFEMLCVVLAENRGSAIIIAKDIGKLYLENSNFEASDFQWLYNSKIVKHLTELERLAIRSKNIMKLLQVYAPVEQKSEELPERKRDKPKSGIALSVWLRREADQATVLWYAEEYRRQTDPEARAIALVAFCRCPFPDDPTPIIEDAKTGCDNLKRQAWEALAYTRHPLVRDFALEMLPDHLDEALPILIKNYCPQDAPLLVRLVKAVSIEHDERSCWHSVHFDILHMDADGLKAPTELIRYLYENTYCSTCRAHALEQMGKRRLLTREILLECLFDSNDDIRTYARRCLNRRKQKQTGMQTD